jgi:hypothetical protein
LNYFRVKKDQRLYRYVLINGQKSFLPGHIYFQINNLHDINSRNGFYIKIRSYEDESILLGNSEPEDVNIWYSKVYWFRPVDFMPKNITEEEIELYLNDHP